MRRVRIAHIITRLCTGGAQENTFHTVRLANRDRFESHLISGPTLGAEGSIEAAVEAAGVEILREPNLVREPNALRDGRALRSLTRRLREGRYDIVHTHTSKAGMIGRIAARRAGVPIVVHTPHGNIFDGYFSPWKTRLFIALERFAARRTDCIIELTKGGIEEHLAVGIGRRAQYDVIFSGIDLSPYEAAITTRDSTRAALGIPPGGLLVGGVGRLEPVKGFTYFVEAAARIAETVPEAHFVIAGSGALENALRAQAAPLGDRMHFLGLRHDVPALMAAFDVLVVPSRNEGMGRVILEAGAAGVPVVAARVGGIPDLVDEGMTGRLVPKEDPEALAGAVIALLRNAEERRAMGANARAKVVPAYSLENMVAAIEQRYEELLNEHKMGRRG
jgi:glycosyltransferase involved in cell wall biosynthesis